MLLWWIRTAIGHSGRMGQIMRGIGNIQLINYLKPYNSSYSIPISSSMGVNFKQILGIPMGGNASSFIADLYLSWCEYCYMTKVVKLTMFRQTCFHIIADIWMISVQLIYRILVTLLKTYRKPYCYRKVEFYSCKQDTFLDLYIRVVDHKFITGI